MPTDPEAVTHVLTQAGPWGVVVSLLVVWAVRLYNALQKSQNGRIDDAKKVGEMLIAQNDKWAEIMEEHTVEISTMRTTLGLLNQTLERWLGKPKK